MALSKSMKDELSGRGRIKATAKLPEIDAYIRKVNKGKRPLRPIEVQVLRQEAQAQLRVIKMNWPVETGTSRAGWSFVISGRANSVAVVFQNPVFYSAWIVLEGSHSVEYGGTPWFHTLLPQVWNAGKPRLTERLKKAIDKTQKEIATLMEQGETKRSAIQQAGQGSAIDVDRVVARMERASTQQERLRAALRRVL